MSQLLLVRHGQASFGSEDYDVLSETGRAQSRVLGAALAARGLRPDLVIRGGMRRHRETAEEMVAGAGWEVPTEVDAGWDEFDHEQVVATLGRSTAGLTRQEFQALFEESTARWISDGDDPSYAESWTAFTTRVARALQRASARTERVVVVVSSGGPIGFVASHLIAGDAQLWPRLNRVCVNTGVTKIVRGGQGASLVSFNAHEHLEHDRALLTYR